MFRIVVLGVDVAVARVRLICGVAATGDGLVTAVVMTGTRRAFKFVYDDVVGVFK